MIVRPSDRSQLVRGSIVSDFVANVVPAAVVAEVDVRVNESMTTEMAILQQSISARRPTRTWTIAPHRWDDGSSRRSFEVSRDVPGTPLQAHQDLLDLLDEQHLRHAAVAEVHVRVQLVPADELDRLETLVIDPSLGREARRGDLPLVQPGRTGSPQRWRPLSPCERGESLPGRAHAAGAAGITNNGGD